MGLRTGLIVLAALLAVGPGPARAQEEAQPQQSQPSIDSLRKDIETLRSEYADRLVALEQRLKALEATQPAAVPAAPAETAAAPAAPPVETAAAPQAPEPAPAAVESLPPGDSGSVPNYAASAGSSKVFNPDIAVIGNFLGAAGRNNREPQPALEMHEVGGCRSRRSSIPTRAPTSSSRLARRVSRSRRASSPSRRCPAAC